MPDEPLDLAHLTLFELSERGLLQLCETVAAGKFAYLPAQRIWLASLGSSMQVDSSNLVRQLIEEQLSKLRQLWMDSERKGVDARKRIESLDRARVIRDVLERMEASKYLVRTVHDFDREPDRLNVDNGVIDLRSGRLLPPNPTMWTRASKLPYDPDAPPPVKFLEFVDQFCCRRKDLALYLLRYLGYAITGEVREQSMMILRGSGGNGKTVLFTILRKVLGDFFGKIEKSTLIDSPDKSTYALAGIEGLRVGLVAEASENDVWEDGRVKQLVGEDTIVARQLYHSFREYPITAKIFVYLNSIPRSAANDHGFYRRLRIFPCDMHVEPESRDLNFAEKLAAEEGTAILHLLVQEACAWYQRGMAPVPECMQDALNEFRLQNDRLRQFLDEETHRTGTIAGSTLYESYRRWCEGHGEPTLKRTTFFREVEKRGIRKIRDPHKETISFFGLSMKIPRRE